MASQYSSIELLKSFWNKTLPLKLELTKMKLELYEGKLEYWPKTLSEDLYSKEYSRNKGSAVLPKLIILEYYLTELEYRGELEFMHYETRVLISETQVLTTLSLLLEYHWKCLCLSYFRNSSITVANSSYDKTSSETRVYPKKCCNHSRILNKTRVL